jgi:hypothetical protein
MIKQGQDIPTMLDAVWDPDTMSLFSTIIAFWFGSRVMEKQDKLAATTVSQQPIVRVSVSKPIAKAAGTGRDK